MLMPFCGAPFDDGPQLCKTCRYRQSGPGQPGFRSCGRVVAQSGAMRTLLNDAALVAPTEGPVLISGETGAGKEVVARAVHANSRRAAKPYLTVNVAALPSELLESELFGHVRGAFTGASTSKRGLFEAATGGSLLLDEVGDMPLGLQTKLLRVLQNGEVRRVGDTRPFFTDVRILCSTHQDLWSLTVEGRFRRDLYYRLVVFTLAVPPLRERREDLLPLAGLFLAEAGHRTGRFTPAARRALLNHSWPGNVRELGNVVQHGAVLSAGRDVDVRHFPRHFFAAGTIEPAPPPLMALAEAERTHIRRVLDACAGNQRDAARVLGISRTTLWRKLIQPQSEDGRAPRRR